ncbi:M20 aminoacylase family protein [Cyanobium sp. NIES-981]|uniref:M20 aminoacylase family protein n=1 Tax=Cyanobium sp. NIES-981 TaxID=1851505 RepID=UPI000B35ABAB|nr:M20 aminoacylase family protein [Cyanobium sp. NIES-981]
MPLIPRILELAPELTAWRRDLHAHPETAFQEVRTAALVAERLRQFGCDAVHTGLARTGVVGVLQAGRSPRRIGLRADMDALHLSEANGFAHRSTDPQRMHACGHDGHTVMLLGAARYLAETRRFNGTVVLIFQPAEENEGGGRQMVEEGLFERFPVDAVYGLHNWPGLAVGRFAIRSGPMMAGCDSLEILVRGRGCHAAMPEEGIDPIAAGAALVQALHTIVSRRVAPSDAAVLSLTQFHAGDTWNVIPQEAVLRGSLRYFDPALRNRLHEQIRAMVAGVAAAHGAKAQLRLIEGYPPTLNRPEQAAAAAAAMAAVVGEAQVERERPPTMGAEDFAYMLQARPGAYGWIGNGPGEGGCLLHNPRYDFNDAILPIGASYWATLVERELAMTPAAPAAAAARPPTPWRAPPGPG